MARLLDQKMKNDSKIDNEKRKMKVNCPNCGHRIHFYAFEKRDRQLCSFCNKYVFKDSKAEFEYRLNEALKKPLVVNETEDGYEVKEIN